MSKQQMEPTIIPIGQDSLIAEWKVPVASEQDDDDPWAGWLDVHGNARTRTVEIAEWGLTPDEARLLARALFAAAEHAEHYVNHRVLELYRLTGSWPELDALPSEVQVAVREALRAAADRERREAEARRVER